MLYYRVLFDCILMSIVNVIMIDSSYNNSFLIGVNHLLNTVRNIIRHFGSLFNIYSPSLALQQIWAQYSETQTQQGAQITSVKLAMATIWRMRFVKASNSRASELHISNKGKEICRSLDKVCSISLEVLAYIIPKYFQRWLRKVRKMVFVRFNYRRMHWGISYLTGFL